MGWITLHSGDKFRVEYNMLRSSFMIVCNASNRYVYVTGDAGHKFQDNLYTAWRKFGLNADEDDVYSWLWLNAGYYRLAS